MNQPTQQKSETTYTHIREAIGKLIDKGQSYIDEEKRQKDAPAWADDLGKKLGECRKKWNDQSFQIAILALVKAGKSTLINSWLGDEFMPAAPVPETARIVRVRHNPKNTLGTLRDGQRQIPGAGEINHYLRRLNAEMREQGMKGIPPSLDELILDASLVTLAGSSLGEQGFEILDTPGPNEAGVNLKKRVSDLLDEVDVIIYLLDYTKLKTEEEAEMLATLAEMRVDLLNSERLFFVVNKIDQKNRNSPELEETAAYVTNILHSQIRGLRITSDRILLISAEQALLARVVENGKASPKALTDFSKKVFGVLAQESDATLVKCQPWASRLFGTSRMLELEDTILSSIYSRRGTILLESLLGDLDRHFGMFSNNLKTRRGALQANQAELKSEMHRLKQDMHDLQARLKRVTDQTTNFQNNISRLVKNEFAGFRQEVDETIDYAFGSYDLGRMVGKVIGFVKNIRGKIGITSNDRSQVEQAAQSLNQEVSDYLMREFQAFMAFLGKEIQQQQKPLFEKLRREVAEISKQVEKVVEKKLQIELLPVPLVFEIPSLVPLDQAVGVAVSTSYETRTRHEKERYLAYKFLWLFPVYKERLVERTETLATHTVAARQIQSFWQNAISDMTKAALLEVDKKIEKDIRTVINQAEGELKRFSDNYVDSITKGIEDASKNEEHRKAVLDQVEYRTGQLRGLLEDIATLKEALVQLKSAPASVVSSKG